MVIYGIIHQMEKLVDFIGEYHHSLDDKGRLMVPSEFRGFLGNGVYITKGMDHCLYLFVEETWQKITKNFYEEIIPSSTELRAFIRMLFSGASYIELDKFRRILIPSPLREYAFLNKEVVLIGALSHIEIWEKTKWLKYKEEAETIFEKNFSLIKK